MGKIETRRVILRSALGLFTEMGFHGTSTAAIARRAEVATGTLFHHFASKTDLINALYLETKMHLRDSLAVGFDADQSVRDRLRTAMVGSLRWATDDREEYRFFVLFQESPDITVETRAQAMRDLSTMNEILEHGRGAGVLKDLPVELLQDLAWRVIQAFIDHVASRPELVDDPAFLDLAFATLWDAIGQDAS